MMHWQQAVTLGFFFVGFAFNAAMTFSPKVNPAMPLVACSMLLFYQFVLWSGGWYS